MISEQELIADEHEEVEAEESLHDLEAKRDGEGDRDTESEQPLAEARYLDVVAVLQQILEGKAVDESKLGALSDVERDALSFFGQVVDGRTRGNEFMFAEKRLEGLNHVLAALQPVLSVGSAHQVLNESLMEIVDGIEALRQKLVGLEDAEEEVVAAPVEKAVEGDKDDDDDKDKKAAQAKAEKDKAKAAAKADDLDLDTQQQQRKKKPSDAWDPDAPDEPEPADPPGARRSTLE